MAAISLVCIHTHLNHFRHINNTVTLVIELMWDEYSLLLSNSSVSELQTPITTHKQSETFHGKLLRGYTQTRLMEFSILRTTQITRVTERKSYYRFKAIELLQIF